MTSVDTTADLRTFLTDVAEGASDKAEWYERLAWRMKERADLLEAVATAATALRDARRHCATTLAAWDAAETDDQIRRAVADDNNAIHARIRADEALDAAVALLEAHQ